MTRHRQRTTANTLKVNSCEMFKYSVKIKAFVGNPELPRLPGLMDIGQTPPWGYRIRTEAKRGDATTTKKKNPDRKR